MNTKFDKAAYAALLKKAIGTRTQKQFAEEIKISPEHLSRQIRQKLQTPPKIETLQKIAAHTTYVTYTDLLKAAGYLDSPALLTTPNAVYRRQLTSTILSALSDRSFRWSIEKSNSCDLAIQITEYPLVHWYFQCIDPAVSTLEKDMLNLLYLEMDSTSKFSFVTDSKETYERYKAAAPRNLGLTISVILVDSLSVIEETLLHFNYALPEHILKLCSFSPLEVSSS